MKTLQSRIFTSIALFCFIILFLGIPFTNWWFNGDDFSGLALGKNVQEFKNILKHFLDGNVNLYFYPSHHPNFTPWGSKAHYPLSFFGVYYRPIQCIYYSCMHNLFGLWAYPYYLINGSLHALNTTLLFNLFFSITGTITTALLPALFFAFHPQIGFRFGHAANFQYYFNFSLMLLTLSTLKNYLDHRQKLFLIFSCLFFTISLFTRETGIVIPGIIMIGSYLYTNHWRWVFIWHSTIALCYFIFRLYLYPLASPTLSTLSFKNFLLGKYSEFLYMTYDTLGLSWLPYGHKILRFSVLACIFFICLFLFLKNTQKKWVLFFLFCYFIMLWPSVIGCYSPRYYYEAAPFILLSLVFLVTFCQCKVACWLKKPCLFLSVIVIVIYGLFTYENLKIREQKLDIIHKGFIALTNDNRITAEMRPLCFLAFPTDGFGTGIEQAAWLFLTKPNTSVYYDPATMLTQCDSNIIENKKWYMCCSKYYTKNYYKLIPLQQGIRITSTDNKKSHFQSPGTYLSMGPKTIHQTALVNGEKIVTDFSLTLDEKYAKLKPLIIIWDYEKKGFKIIDLFANGQVS